MIIQLKINEKKNHIYVVDAYLSTPYSREYISSFTGTIPEIKKFLENEYEQPVTIESSIFDGWY